MNRLLTSILVSLVAANTALQADPSRPRLVVGIVVITLSLLLIVRGTHAQFSNPAILIMILSGIGLAALYAIIGASESYYNIIGSTPDPSRSPSRQGAGSLSARRATPSRKKGGATKRERH